MATYDDFAAAVAALQDDFIIVGSEQPPDDAAIDEMAARLGVRLPASYRELVGAHAALAIEAKEEVWPAPKPLQVGPYWSFLRGFEVLAFGPDVPDFLQLEPETRVFRQETGLDWTPFAAQTGSGDRFCFLPDGTIVEWFHDEPPAEPGDERVAAADVYELLVKLANRLAENVERIKRGEHLPKDG